jgi:DNA-binding HxlR family transcriptional regulator
MPDEVGVQDAVIVVGRVGEGWAARDVSHRVDAGDSLGSNVLNDRLRVLVDEGILDRVRYQDHPARYEYRLTTKGADLYPVLLSRTAWGEKYKIDVPPVRLIHRGCGHAAEPHVTCAHCGEPVSWREMTAEFQPDAW